MKANLTIHDALDIAHKHTLTSNAPMLSSACVCLQDARETVKQGRINDAIGRCADSLAYSVGVFHPDYQAVKKFHQQHSDFGLLLGDDDDHPAGFEGWDDFNSYCDELEQSA